jgi:two-component system KDP operon response regulator KdpE
MPGSIETIRLIREASDVPIVFAIYMGDSIGIDGLRAGADTVIVKPYFSELLLAQVESLVRRKGLTTSEVPENEYVFEKLSVNFRARSVSVEGERIRLSAREYRLLQVLATNAGIVMTHEQLLRLVWGPGYEDSGDLLRGYVRNLRRKIQDDARRPHFIYTESQIGYWMRRPDSVQQR